MKLLSYVCVAAGQNRLGGDRSALAEPGGAGIGAVTVVEIPPGSRQPAAASPAAAAYHLRLLQRIAGPACRWAR